MFSVYTAWVKNVYSWCTAAQTEDKKSAQFVTASVLQHALGIAASAQAAGYTHTIDSFTPSPYTAFLAILPLKKYQFCTPSTVPITTEAIKK